MDTPADRTSLLELSTLFLRLGLTAFGGPAAHVALMQDEFVRRKKWLSDEQFLDLLGATNLIPGPNSTEMAIHIGFLRAGYAGLVVAGSCFILPAMLIVLGLAWMYVRYGSTTQVNWVLYGVKPVIISIIALALWSLGKKAVKGILAFLLGAGVLALYLLGVNELLLLFSAGILYMLVLQGMKIGAGKSASLFAWLGSNMGEVLPAKLAVGVIVAVPAAFSLGVLFLTFLKIGAVLYGGGYVLLAFLRADFVERLGWLSETQLIDAIAIGQVTPGPLFTSATFLGYLLGGLPGAVLATVGIFLPAFVFVALTNPLIPRIRSSAWAGSLLDGVNISSLGLMAGVTLQLSRAALVDLFAALLAAVSAGLLFRFRVNSTWLILGGGTAGILYQFVSALLRSP
jgi:chromate transporter